MTAEFSPESIAVAELQKQFSHQKKAFQALPFPSLQERLRRLEVLRQLIKTNEQAIADAISQDFGSRATIETETAEILPSLMGIRDAKKHLKGWMKPKRAMVPLLFQPASARIVPQPLGVVGIIVPWNYPLYLAVGPLIAALAAGNHALIKMSEFTPTFGALFEQLITAAFPQGEVRVVNGEVEVARAFSSLPFDHLLFTGSTAVGKHIMRAASENLVPVTLELGGKSPVVIDRSIDYGEVAKRLVYPKFLNAGQTCVSPDYVYCPDESVEGFVDAFLAEAKRQLGDVSRNEDYSSIVNERQRQRLLDVIADAEAKGAKIHTLDPTLLKTAGPGKLPPTVVTDVTDDMRIMQEELFGPVVPVVSYRGLDEVVQDIQNRPRPLALYVFGHEKRLRPLFEQKTHSGGLVFNDALIQVAMDTLPFGGVGPSGMGHYHSHYGFETFSKLKPVVSKGRVNSLALVYPPYNRTLINAIRSIFGR